MLFAIDDREKISVYEHKNVKAYVREGTSDSFIVEEVLGGEYNKLNIQEGDVVADFGLNIGIFACWASMRGAKEVWGYEPDEDNFELAKRNVDLNGFANRCKLFNDAVVGNDDTTRRFSVNVKKNKAAHSLVTKRGRDTCIVTCRNFNTVLEEMRPTVIKMDIEGGELEILRNLKPGILSGVREFIMEFHHAHLNDIGSEVIFKEVIDIMQNHFDTVKYRAEPNGAWVSNIYCYNEN